VVEGVVVVIVVVASVVVVVDVVVVVIVVSVVVVGIVVVGSEQNHSWKRTLRHSTAAHLDNPSRVCRNKHRIQHDSQSCT